MFFEYNAVFFVFPDGIVSPDVIPPSTGRTMHWTMPQTLSEHEVNPPVDGTAATEPTDGLSFVHSGFFNKTAAADMTEEDIKTSQNDAAVIEYRMH